MKDPVTCRYLGALGVPDTCPGGLEAEGVTAGGFCTAPEDETNTPQLNL